MKVTHVAVTYGETKSLPGQFGNVRSEVRLEADLESVDVVNAEVAVGMLQNQARTEVMREIDKGLKMRSGPEFAGD